MRLSRKLLSALAILSLVSAGCGAAGEDQQATEASTEASEIYKELATMPYDERMTLIEERAREEGQVVIYSSRDSDTLQAWKEDFNKLYPGVEFRFLSAEPEAIYQRIGQETRGGADTADLVLVGEELKVLNDEGLLAELHGAMIPEGFPDDGYGEWYMSFGPSPLVTVWNTKLLDAEDAPTRWEDLLDPRFKGQVAIEADPTHFVRALIKEWGYEKARDYFDKLVNQNGAQIRKGHTNITNLLTAGEFTVAAELYGHKTEKTIAKGAPLDWVALDPTPTGVGGFGITAASPHPYAAALASHYMLTERGGEVWASDGRLHLHPDVDPLYPRTGELIGNPRLEETSPEEGFEPLEQAQKLIKEVIVPAYTGEGG